MSRLVLVALLAALVVPVALPPAAAHVESYAQSRALTVGPYLVFFEPRPTPPFAETPASMVAQVSDGNTGTLLREVDASILVAGPADYVLRKKTEPDGTGYFVASTTFPAAGNYTARFMIHDAPRNETFFANAEFEVFPNIPYRIRPVDAAADTFTGERSRLAFEVLDPLTLARKDVPDLRVRVEHWTEDHTQKLGEEQVAPVRVTPGVWRIDHVFTNVGMYHIRFASDGGGFNYPDVPLLHVYATKPPGAASEGADTPALPLAGIVLAVALALALTRRR